MSKVFDKLLNKAQRDERLFDLIITLEQTGTGEMLEVLEQLVKIVREMNNGE